MATKQCELCGAELPTPPNDGFILYNYPGAHTHDRTARKVVCPSCIASGVALGRYIRVSNFAFERTE